jgi:hypothetical protein
LNLARSFADLADQIDREQDQHIRILRADGSTLEGTILDITPTGLRLLNSATGEQVTVPALELHAVEVQRPRRVREWTLAIFSIPVTTAALVGFAQLPWARPDPDGGYVLIGFVIFCALVGGLISIPMIRRWLGAWLTRWQRIYSTAAPETEPR